MPKERLITYKNKTMSLKEWGRERNIRPDTISARLEKGWKIHDALYTPTQKPKQYEYKGEKKILKDWAALYGFSIKQLDNRMAIGWSLERALLTPIDKSRQRLNQAVREYTYAGPLTKPPKIHFPPLEEHKRYRIDGKEYIFAGFVQGYNRKFAMFTNTQKHKYVETFTNVQLMHSEVTRVDSGKHSGKREAA